MKNITAQQAHQLLQEAQQMPREERLKLQEKRLHELVDEVRKTSPYFKKLYEKLPEEYSLTDLPYTEKAGLMEKYEDWVTDREITAEGVAQYLNRDISDTSQYLGKYSALTTSGTTGAAMPMLRDSYHNVIHGVMLGMRLLGGVEENFGDLSCHKIAAIIFTDPHVSSYGSFLKARELQKEYAENMIAISPLVGTDVLVQKLNEFQPDMLTCYPSALCALAVEQQRGNLKISPRLISCSAEVLTEEMYQLFTETFHSKVINNYCSTEGGEAAMASACSHLHINEDWVIIEPVDKDKKPITDSNEWSEGVLITDLTNYLQPVIRYYMNDKIKIHNHCTCGNSFPYMEIRGRSGGITQVCGKTIIIANFYSVVEYIEHTYTLQVVQTADDSLELRAVLMEDADPEAVFQIMENRLKELLDREGCQNYKIIRSDKLPLRNEHGGKYQYFIKNMG